MVTQTPLNIINVFPSEASYESNKGSLGANEISLVSGVGVILESYTSDTSWYRKWSDGWIEQGGRVTNATSSGRVTLNKPMKDTNYTIICQEGSTGSFEATDDDTGGYDLNIGITDGTTTSFRYTIVSASYFNWYVCGMGA